MVTRDCLALTSADWKYVVVNQCTVHCFIIASLALYPSADSIDLSVNDLKVSELYKVSAGI